MWKMFIVILVAGNLQAGPVGVAQVPLEFHDEESCMEFRGQNWGIQTQPDTIAFDAQCVKVSEPT